MGAEQSISECFGCTATDILSKYELGKQIGRGHFGVVRLCMDKTTGKKYAVKMILKTGNMDLDRLRKEVDIMKKAGRHPNIVALIDVFEDENCMYLVMEYCSGGDLLNSIINEGKYSQERAARYLRQMASALKYLHTRGIVHRDLKPENIMLSDNTPDAQIKLVDFGLAALVQANEPMRTICGTWAYYAPELVHHQPYTHTVDIWTLGILMFILLAGYHPFDVHGDAIKSEVLRKIEKADFTYNDPVWDDVDPEAKQIINSLLQINSKDRITLAQFLDTHFVKRGPHRPELMADIMRRFDRMRSARDTVKSSSLAKLRLNRSVRAVYHECVRRRLISHGQNIIPSRARFAAAKLPAAAFEHPHFVREDLIPLPMPPPLPAPSVMRASARLSSGELDEMKGALDAWSDMERDSRAKSQLAFNPLARQVFALEEEKELTENQLIVEQNSLTAREAQKRADALLNQVDPKQQAALDLIRQASTDKMAAAMATVVKSEKSRDKETEAERAERRERRRREKASSSSAGAMSLDSEDQPVAVSAGAVLAAESSKEKKKKKKSSDPDSEKEKRRKSKKTASADDANLDDESKSRRSKKHSSADAQ